MVLITMDESVKDSIEFCERCGRGSSKCETSLKSKQETFILCFCNSLVRKRRQSRRRNTTIEKSQYHHQPGNTSTRRTSLPARINTMGAVESKNIVVGNQTPISHRKVLGDPRSPTTGIERTPIAVEKAIVESPAISECNLNTTPMKGHFLEDPRSPNCPRTPIPLCDPRSPCETVSRTPIFVKPMSGHESEKSDTDKFVFDGNQSSSPPKIETTEEKSTSGIVKDEKIKSTVKEITECLKQISTPEYDEELATLVRTNVRNEIICKDDETKDLPKNSKPNRLSLKKIQKKKIQEMSHGQQRSPLATRNRHSDSPVFTNKTKSYVRFDHNGGDFRKRQSSFGSTGTRLSAKFEIFTEKENV